MLPSAEKSKQQQKTKMRCTQVVIATKIDRYVAVQESLWIWGEKCIGSCHSHLNLGLEVLDSATPKQDLLTVLGYRPLKKLNDRFSHLEFIACLPTKQHFSRVLFPSQFQHLQLVLCLQILKLLSNIKRGFLFSVWFPTLAIKSLSSPGWHGSVD